MYTHMVIRKHLVIDSRLEQQSHAAGTQLLSQPHD